MIQQNRKDHPPGKGKNREHNKFYIVPSMIYKNIRQENAGVLVIDEFESERLGGI